MTLVIPSMGLKLVQSHVPTSLECASLLVIPTVSFEPHHSFMQLAPSEAT